MRFCRAATLAASLIAAVACHDSTGPRGPTAQATAQYYDAYAGRLLAAGTATDTALADWVETLLGPIAYGRAPSAIAVAAGGTTPIWMANGVLLVDSSGADSGFVVSAWSDTLVSSYLFGVVGSSTTTWGLWQVAGDSVAGVYSDTVAVTVNAKVVSGSCDTTTVITHISVLAPTYDPANTRCSPATFTIAGHIHFTSGAGIASQFQDIDLPSTTITAVRLQALHGETF